MEKQELYKYLDKLIENYNRFIIMVLFLKNIVEKSEDNEITNKELEFDLQEIEILFTVQVERLIKFEKRITEMYQRYDINKTDINLENVQNVMDDLLSLIKGLKEE
jgi:hypothetical protein